MHTHVRNAIAKLEVDTRTEAVALAVSFSYLGAGGGLARPPGYSLLVELQRAAVDAVALAARSAGPVVEDVAEVGVAVSCRRPRCGA